MKKLFAVIAIAVIGAACFYAGYKTANRLPVVDLSWEAEFLESRAY